MNKIHLFILDPSNLSLKYKHEHELQKIFYKNSIFEIHYIPSRYPELRYFNKLFSIFDFSFEYPENSFYCDHDVFLKNNFKYFQNLFTKKIFLRYKFQNYNWKEIFKEKLGIEIEPKTDVRLSSCFFPLDSHFLKSVYKEIENFKKINTKFLNYSGSFEEYFFSIPIKNNKTILLNTEDINQNIFVLHYKIPNKFILNLIVKDKESKKIFNKLEKIYKVKK